MTIEHDVEFAREVFDWANRVRAEGAVLYQRVRASPARASHSQLLHKVDLALVRVAEYAGYVIARCMASEIENVGDTHGNTKS